jgi:DMSO/TMAO reductase YedYZ molybdopterin-dependent catalytic subunit
VSLPPGQRRVEGFPRFGAHLTSAPPPSPPQPTIDIGGDVVEAATFPLTDLAGLPRREMTADFHCVAGWTATGLPWGGVPFADFYRTVIEPRVDPATAITHVALSGLDGYRIIIELQDALGDDVLLADRLDGEPLEPDHGAPVRLVSPSQYGFVSCKHLCRVDVHARDPGGRYHPSPLMELGLRLVRPHPRARVWQEERHRHLPASAVRPVYRALIGPIRQLSRRGSATDRRSR